MKIIRYTYFLDSRKGDSRWEGKRGRLPRDEMANETQRVTRNLTGRLPQNDMAYDTGRLTRNVRGRQARNEMANARGDA